MTILSDSSLHALPTFSAIILWCCLKVLSQLYNSMIHIGIYMKNAVYGPCGLFGIKNSNRPDKQHWTKNCFNSSFPTSLACYMLDQKIPAVYAKLAIINNKLKIVCDVINISDFFNCNETSIDNLQFDFESRYDPYQSYSFDSIDGIDLVVKDLHGQFLAPVEVKLTVLPTSATADKPQAEWGSEIVVRTATTSYCAFSIWDKVKNDKDKVREIFEDSCIKVGDWTNDYEVSHKTPELRSVLDLFEQNYIDYQQPLVMQTFWKTNGQSPILMENAFDIIVWSNLAFTRLFIETSNDKKMSRPMRASARMARCLWELSKSGKIRTDKIYREMAFGQQTDKEVSVPGERWRRYITTDRVIKPSIHKDVLSKIIEPGYIEYLRPERRFDQTLYCTAKH